MKITLYSAISIDGFIAKEDGNSDWVSDTDGEIFDKTCKKTRCIFVGRRTFDQFKGEIYPIQSVTNIVLTSNKNQQPTEENTFYFNSVREAIKTAEEKGHNEAILVGGAKTNESFLTENVIDEIILSIHPLVLGSWLKIFNKYSGEIRMNLVKTESMKNELVYVYYKVNK